MAWSGAFLKTFEKMRKLDFSRLPATAAVLAHLGAGSLKKSNFLILSKVLRKGADQANLPNSICNKGRCILVTNFKPNQLSR